MNIFLGEFSHPGEIKLELKFFFPVKFRKKVPVF